MMSYTAALYNDVIVIGKLLIWNLKDNPQGL